MFTSSKKMKKNYQNLILVLVIMVVILTALAVLYNDSPESVAYSALIDDSKPSVKSFKKKQK